MDSYLLAEYCFNMNVGWYDREMSSSHARTHAG